MLFSKVGHVVRISGSDMIATSKGESGVVVYGPYVVLTPGHYEVDFHIIPAKPSRWRCCRIDILRPNYGFVAQRDLSGAELAKTATVTLPFEIKEEGTYEFRVTSTGRVGLKVTYDRPLRRMSALPASASHVFKTTLATPPDLFGTHHAIFENFQRAGIVFDVDSSGSIIATYNGVTFTVANAEDLQLVGEIFLINEYQFVSNDDAIAIDIGMNVGLTSLYFANMSNVKNVYSFEPFAGPYGRAEKNFARNPVLRRKIESRQIGLSNGNRTEHVLSVAGQTIGVSIRGNSAGDNEMIHIADAAEILGPIFQRAVESRQRILMKIDCEGSEFAIFDVLHATGLIDRVSAIVCEWHKWWDPAKSQSDLINPLLSRGFLVVDRTNPGDPHAGLFYAIKAPPLH